MVQVRWTGRARRDLRAIHDFIAVDNPTVARRLIGQLVSSTERLREFPQSGRRIPRFERLGVREIVRSPYRIAYRIVDDQVRILKIHHGARLLRAAGLSEDASD